MSFFGNPAGYVFIILFAGLTAWFAFVDDQFFANNLATLDLLTRAMPWVLMVFVSSVTMSSWAEEKKLGTEELLFTLPSGDFEVVLGKYLANLAVFTAALCFTLTHVLVLFLLGSPDLGVLFSTYLGYWLLGAAFIATGMFASSLTHNITVGFIFGALFCALFAATDQLAQIFSGRVGDWISGIAAITHLESFGRGVIAFDDVVYFGSIVVGMLYINTVILSRRRWPGGYVPFNENPWFHYPIRVVSVVVILICGNIILARFDARLDISEERLSSLSDETYQVLDELDAKRPVTIRAWISEEVPANYIETRDNLLGLLREYDKRGGDAVQVAVYRPDRYSEEAREAQEQFNIGPVPVMDQQDGQITSTEIFLGAAFSCGVEEDVIPFFHPRIPVEYELTRTIRVVTKGDRPKVGVIENELKLLGGFDFQTRNRFPTWQVVEELKKQYEVESLSAASPIPDDVDVILCALPSLMREEELDNLIAAVEAGKKAVILMDPLPITKVDLSPNLPRPSPQQQNPFMMNRQPPSDPKCNLSRLLNKLGVRFDQNSIIWDSYNPHTQFGDWPPVYVNIMDRGEGDAGFNSGDAVSSDLQEMLALFPGSLSRTGEAEGDLKFKPLLTTGSFTSGTVAWNQCVTQHPFFGTQITWNNEIVLRATPQNYVLAARVTGDLAVEVEEVPAEGEEGDGEKPAEPVKTTKRVPLDVILTADVDMISDLFFQLRKSDREGFNFDNVAFVLNCVDSLAGDDSYIELRKRRRKARTLSAIEKEVDKFNKVKLEEEDAAETVARDQLDKAKESFDEKVRAVEGRTDMDMRTKEIMTLTVRKKEQQKLDATKARIEEEKSKKTEEARFEMEQKKRGLRTVKKIYAMAFPIIAPLFIGIFIFFYRLFRENRGAANSRLVKD